MFDQIEQRVWCVNRLRTIRKGRIIALVSLICLLAASVAMLAFLIFPDNLQLDRIRRGLNIYVLLVVISSIIALVGIVFYLVGLYGLRSLRPEYRLAFRLTLAELLLAVVNDRVGKGILFEHLVDLAGTGLNLAILWLVLRATVSMVEESAQGTLTRQGDLVWRLELAAAAGGVILMIWDTASILNTAASILQTVVALAAEIWYIRYLGLAADTVRECI